MPAKSSSKSAPAKKGPYVASVAVMVSDLPKAKKWYTEKLGLSVLMDGEHWVTVGRKEKGAALHLCTASPDGFPLEPGTSGILLIFDGDLKKECAQLKQRGVEFVHEPTLQPWGVWDASIRDLDGNEILLMDEEE